jgi:hypothetical protein
MPAASGRCPRGIRGGAIGGPADSTKIRAPGSKGRPPDRLTRVGARNPSGVPRAGVGLQGAALKDRVSKRANAEGEP